MTDQERWLPVPGHAAHEVSDQGRVRTVDRWVMCRNQTRRFFAGKVLKVHPHPRTGHLLVKLSHDGVKSHGRVHMLVMEAFVGPPPQGTEVCHNNGQPEDNRLSNLRYGTTTDNRLDSVQHGTHNMSSRTHCKNGHAFDKANTFARSSGGRGCRTCRYEISKASHQRRRHSWPSNSKSSPAPVSGS